MRKTIEKYCRGCVLAFLIISLSISPLAIGAEQDPVGDEQKVLKTARQRLRTKITYSCTELPIENVLMDLAEQAKIDIVKSPKVTGNVTAKVTDVPLEEALSNILAAHDYTYIATESMIRVMPLSEIAVAREELVTRIYRITYADANEVANALRNFVSQRGKVALNKGTSHIIVTDTESQIKGIDKFIEEIDFMTPQVLVEVRIYDITSSEGFELGSQWHAGRNAPLKTTEHRKVDIDTDFPAALTETTTTVIGPSSTAFSEDRTDTTQPFDVETTTIRGPTTTTTHGIYRDSDDGITPKSYDVDTVESTDTETVKTPLITETREEYGGNIDSGRTDTETTVTELPMGSYMHTTTERYTTRRRKPFVGGSFDSITGGTLRFSILNDAVDIDLALSMLHKEVEAKLLANPRVLVLDNETANFEIVREIPYRELRQVAREDPITYTEYKNVGVELNVTPHIARDGMIRLHIAPKFGVVVGQNLQGAPVVDTRRADTIAMIKDGQTIVMGGLRKRQTTKDISKVPLLGDLPLVGGLFKSETESVEINELVIFITTRIVTEPVLSAIEKRQFEATEFAGPEITEMRLERNNQSKTEADALDIKESLESFLQRLKTPK